ncbi:hypothetical protein [Micromonospora sp. CA-244673]|uniref:hypothetical protein n=1 Tax=Micromonospora sp. CA-244673 TaxID=3239958 RepID=UPI003D944938
MSPIDDSYHPADAFDSARRTAVHHADGDTCFNCTDSKTCAQYAWALDELARHPGGLDVLKKLKVPVPLEAPSEEGQQR